MYISGYIYAIINYLGLGLGLGLGRSGGGSARTGKGDVGLRSQTKF
jgi:hypothetical protein